MCSGAGFTYISLQTLKKCQPISECMSVENWHDVRCHFTSNWELDIVGTRGDCHEGTWHLINGLANSNEAGGHGRGDYDYCRVPGTRQLSPLEVGENNSKFEPKKTKENSNQSIWSNKRFLWEFLGMLSPNLASVLCWLSSFTGFWPIFSLNTWRFLPFFD